MEFAEVKRSILSEVVRQGYTKAEEIPANLLTDLPLDRVQRWLDRFWKAPKPESLNPSPRLVNHFALGADPEFAFTDNAGVMANAMDFGLQAGLAFGMDINGRLAELRPAPSRFALEVVASILTELRWLAILNPGLREYSWISKPNVARDGLGGHVHFGRKRVGETRQREVKTLDRLTALLASGGIFDSYSMQKRRAANGNYGAYGDIRPQKHGYEYRTMPTWLDSPWSAHLILTLSKLLVHDPELFPRKEVPAKRFIRNLLAYYKSMDDDALIAYNALSVLGLPQQTGIDFKAAWGINYTKERPPIQYVPPVIYGTQADKQAIFDYLRTGRPIYPEIPEPTWPTTLPEGYRLALDWTTTHHRVGMGELVHSLVVHQELPVTFSVAENKNRLSISSLEGSSLPNDREVEARLGDVEYRSRFLPRRQLATIDVSTGEYLRGNNSVGKLKKFLCEFLPIWHIEDVRPESFAEWQRNIRQKTESSSKLRGKEITQEVI